jgi:tetratricopeptide (TPR) repeat protein
VHLDNKNLHSAKNTFVELLPLYEETNDINSLCELNINLGYMYYLLGENEPSEQAYKKGFEYALKIGDEEYIYRSGIALIKHYAKSGKVDLINEIKSKLNNYDCPIFLEAQYLLATSKSCDNKIEQENSLLLALYKSQNNNNTLLTKEISEELVRLYKRKGDVERALQFAELALDSSNIIINNYEKGLFKR